MSVLLCGWVERELSILGDDMPISKPRYCG
jgi:hypothetical protein